MSIGKVKTKASEKSQQNQNRILVPLKLMKWWFKFFKYFVLQDS